MSKKKLETLAEILGGHDPEKGLNDDMGVSEVGLTDLFPFEDHPFRLYEGKQLDNMVESIKEFGVMVPIIVRRKGSNVYEILSGHNRVNAAGLAGLTKVPAVIHDNLPDDEAVLIVTETNFMQRSLDEMLPSEKAKAFEMEMQALKRQGKKVGWFDDDSTSTTQLSKWRSDEVVGGENGISREMVRRYRRLNHLVPGLLDLVDRSEIPLQAAVFVSYLGMPEQDMLLEKVDKYGYKLNTKKAEMLRACFQAGQLTDDKIVAVLEGKSNKKTMTAFKLSSKIISRFFKPEQGGDEIEEIINKALDLYFSER